MAGRGDSAELRDRVQQALGSGYGIERELEGGGMSRVFLARDTALNREIVAKVLRPELFTGVSVERFEREIALVAALQHPHIVPLLGAGHLPAAGMDSGLPYYTMPFIRGESLRARLSRSGELPVAETVHILRDIASALAHAHAEGVVHRDIKPENVMLSGGVAVVLDFGVAKAVNLAVSGGTAPQSLTSRGLALGTPAYMSPEQAGGDPQIDHRTDIYSFGCLAYEMLSGASPFVNRPPQQMLAAHVTEAPEDLARRRARLPAQLANLVMRCLEKRASDRPQSAAELLAALDALSTPSVGMEPTSARLAVPRFRRRPAVALGVGLVAVSGIIGWVWARRFRPLTVVSTGPLLATRDIEEQPSISPDGSLVAYVVRPADSNVSRLMVRQVSGGTGVPVATSVPGNQRAPSWSPDGTRILFQSSGGQGSGGWAIYMAPYVGGTARRLQEGSQPAWHPDGRRFASVRGGQIILQDLEGGPSSVLADSVPTAIQIAFSPDGGRLAYSTGGPVRQFGNWTVWVMTLPDGQPVRLNDTTHNAWNPVWAPDGNSILYLSDSLGVPDIYQKRLRDEHGVPGPPSRLTTGLEVEWFSLDRAGTRAAYAKFRRAGGIYAAPIHPDRETQPSELTEVTRELQNPGYPDISPDGQWLAFQSDLAGVSGLYKVRVEGGQAIQIMSSRYPAFVPRWSPDGQEIAYHSLRAGHRDIRVVSAEGRDDRPVTDMPGMQIQPTWSPDGQSLAYVSLEASRETELRIVSRGLDQAWSQDRPLLLGQGFALPRWSPDGKWIAFGRGGGLLLAATSGGAAGVLLEAGALGGPVGSPLWSSDSRTVYVSVQEPGSAFAYWAVPMDRSRPRRLLRVANGAAGMFATDGRRIFLGMVSAEGDIGIMELRP